MRAKGRSRSSPPPASARVSLRVAFTPAASLALARFTEVEQLAILENIQEAVKMCSNGSCHKMIKLRKVPHMYRIVCGRCRAICTRFGDTVMITDVLLRNERTYRFMRG